MTKTKTDYAQENLPAHIADDFSWLIDWSYDVRTLQRTTASLMSLPSAG